MNMEKGFFKVFNPTTSAKQMKIPTGYTIFKSGKLPRKVILRVRFGNKWTIRVIKQERDFYFKYGWEKFIEDNILEFGDFLIFENDGKGTFDFKLLGLNECVKKGIGGKSEEKMSIEHQKIVESKGKTYANDSISSSEDDSTADCMIEVVSKEVTENKEKGETQKIAPHSKRRYVEEKKYEKTQGEEEDEENNEKVGTCKKKAQRSKAECRKATACKVKDVPDHYGADIFKSGRATQPKNPYFVTKIQAEESDQLYILVDVWKDYKLQLPSSITIRNSTGREFEARVSTWNNNRKWLVGRWLNLCRLNFVEKDDRCICEFVRGKCDKGIYLQVQILHEGSSFNPNNELKK